MTEWIWPEDQTWEAVAKLPLADQAHAYLYGKFPDGRRVLGSWTRPHETIAKYVEAQAARLSTLEAALGDLLDIVDEVDWRMTTQRKIERARAALSGEAQACDHEWVDARNEAIISGEMCPKCGAVRASEEAQSE